MRYTPSKFNINRLHFYFYVFSFCLPVHKQNQLPIPTQSNEKSAKLTADYENRNSALLNLYAKSYTAWGLEYKYNGLNDCNLSNNVRTGWKLWLWVTLFWQLCAPFCHTNIIIRKVIVARTLSHLPFYSLIKCAFLSSCERKCRLQFLDTETNK